MPKNYADIDTDELQKLAEDQEKRQNALKQLAQRDPRAIAAMSNGDRAEFIKNREQQVQDERHRKEMAAHTRYLEGVASREAGRYNPRQQQAAINWLRETGFGSEGERRRQFDEMQRTEREKAEWEAEGKIGYGFDAAEIQSAANKEIAKTEWGTKEKIAKGEIAAKKWLGTTESKDRRYGIDAEHGKIDKDGKVTPGSRERMATIGAETNARQAELQRQHELEKQKIISDGNVEAARVSGEARVGAAEARGEQFNQRSFETWINNELGGDPGKHTLSTEERLALKHMTVDQQKAYYMKKYGRATTGSDQVKKGMSDYESK